MCPFREFSAENIITKNVTLVNRLAKIVGQIMICSETRGRRGCGGCEGRGGRDFRFFEKKLGKKLPCWVVALKAILRFIIDIKGYNPARKLLRSFSRKATTRPLRPPHPPRISCVSEQIIIYYQ